MKFVKILAPVALALTISGCQTDARGPVNVTQQVYGNVDPAVSSNWKAVVSRTGSIAYVCPADRCRDPGAIGYTVVHVDADAEYLVREKIISAGLIHEIGNSLSQVTEGQFRQISVRDLTNKKAAGFESATSLDTADGPYYSVSRVGINGNELRVVTGIGKSLPKARQNLRVGLNGIK